MTGPLTDRQLAADAHWARHFRDKAKRLEAEVTQVAAERDAARREAERRRVALAEIAEGCGHTRCHAYPWIRAARKALEP